MVRIATEGADAGALPLITILVAVNIFIGVLNMLPMLPLDGGYVAIATYERLRTRRGKASYHADINKLGPGGLRLHERASGALCLHPVSGHRPPDPEPLLSRRFARVLNTADWRHGCHRHFFNAPSRHAPDQRGISKSGR